MKIHLTKIWPVLFLPLALPAAQPFNAGIEPFRALTSFDSALMGLDFRVAPLAGIDRGDGATHVLIKGLRPLETSSSVYESGYEAINLEEGSRLDVGTVYLQMPTAALPEGSVASPIVGVVQRQGSWEGHGPQTPAETTVGGASGASTYDPAATSMTLNLQRNGQTFNGTVGYTVVDTETLTLGPLTLTSGAQTYTFHESVLYREGGRFYGVLQTADLAADYESLLFAIELKDFPDIDRDGIPDLVDPDTGGEQPPLNLLVGEWTSDLRIGSLRALNARWAESEQLGMVYYETFPWLYHEHLGWLRYMEYSATSDPEGIRRLYYQQDGHYIWFWSAPQQAACFFYFRGPNGASGWDAFAGEGEFQHGSFPFITR